ncbi:sensor domain-containing protein [Streptomyces sp. DSM 44915]|uniref:Sensor domain-containing protein n=1 Tax=Streptomyces chisholmiae TaxID=3075540 RepID=A0ABU2JZQ9_9ACTN|nr:sensor domain-containing protein [Streptomyces sp. DSM 44915]MDT0270483.1 sensor domain-containing protein [Streptomyces sp. DSM 44915]
MSVVLEHAESGRPTTGAPAARPTHDPAQPADQHGRYGQHGGQHDGSAPYGGLGPVGREAWLVAAAKAPWRGLGLGLVSLLVSVPLFSLLMVSIGLIPVGIGLYTTPVLLGALRHFADWRRSLVARWGGVPLPAPRRAHWAPGTVAPVRTLVLLRDPSTWRQLWWLLTDMTAGSVTALLPFGLLAHGAYGWVLAAGVWEPIHDADGAFWYAFVQVQGQGDANLAALVGTGTAVLGLLAGRALLRGHFAVTRSMLRNA